MLLLKLTLVPLLIAAVTLAGRRWGDRVAWLLMALPVVAGPTLYFYALEQGPAFAADAARATMLGLVAAATFSIAYVWLSTHWSWLPTVLLSWAAFGMVTMPLMEVELPAAGAFAAAVVALLAVRTAIPRVTTLAGPVSRPWWDVPLRMLAASVLVLVLTSVADRLGARVSGALTPFPVATAIIAGFTHAQEGPAAVARFFRGFIPGLCTFALFCVVLATALQSLPIATAFAVALALQLLAQAVITFAPRLPSGTLPAVIVMAMLGAGCGGSSVSSSTAPSPSPAPTPSPAPAPAASAGTGRFSVVLPAAASDVGTLAFGLNAFGIHFGGTGFGGHGLDGHPGWDVEMRPGAPIRAAADGTVQSVFTDSFTTTRSVVQIQHRDSAGSYRTVYTNVEGVPAGVRADATVLRGQIIGTAGAQTLTIGTRTLTYGMTHFQVDDFSRNEGATNPNAVNPESFLDASGRELFDAVWRGAAYSVEVSEPFTGNTRDVTFPFTRSWTRQSGGSLSRIDFTRREAGTSAHAYVLYDAAGAVIERGSVVFEAATGGLSSIDFQAEGGTTRRGVVDIVGDAMRIDLAVPGAARPAGLSAASVFRTQ